MTGEYKAWLPEFITVDDIANNQEKLIDESYKAFIEDYLNDQIFFKHYPVHYKRHPEIDGKHGTFHHIISSDDDVSPARVWNFDRIQRVRWAKALIINYNDQDILKWENKRHGKLRICLYLLAEKYIVVLDPRKDVNGNKFMLLWTAYVVDRNRDHLRLMKEYNDFKMADAAYL